MKYLIGPELYWIMLNIISFVIAKTNSDGSNNDFIEQSWAYIPLLSILCFGLYFIPFVEKNWLLTRIILSSLILGHFALNTIINAHTKQGPGVGMGYLAGMLFLLIILGICSIVVKFIR